MFDESYPSIEPSPPMRAAKPDAGVPGLNAVSAEPSGVNANCVVAVVVHAALVHGMMVPFSDGVSFAPGTTLKFGRPLPTPAGVLKPAVLLLMAQASLHQSRVCEQGPIRSCFWYSTPTST